MTTHDRHPQQEQHPDIPTTTSAERTAVFDGGTQSRHAERAMAPPDPQHEEPALTTGSGRSEPGAGDERLWAASGSAQRESAQAAGYTPSEYPEAAGSVSAASAEPATEDGASSVGPVDTTQIENESPSESALFADDDRAGLRAQWDSVQAAFVDDPRVCVQRADGLVSDVVGQLTAGFTTARSHLEQQWNRGEEASTEDLRVALTRYRDFFDRLLTV